MPKFLVTMQEKQYTYYTKVFEANSDVEAENLAEMEGVHEDGWDEEDHRTTSKQTVETVERID